MKLIFGALKHKESMSSVCGNYDNEMKACDCGKIPLRKGKP